MMDMWNKNNDLDLFDDDKREMAPKREMPFAREISPKREIASKRDIDDIPTFKKYNNEPEDLDELNVNTDISVDEMRNISNELKKVNIALNSTPYQKDYSKEDRVDVFRMSDGKIKIVSKKLNTEEIFENPNPEVVGRLVIKWATELSRDEKRKAVEMLARGEEPKDKQMHDFLSKILSKIIEMIEKGEF